MNAVKSLLVATGLTLSLLAGGAKAEAANHYAAVDIRNPSNVTVYYSFRWGESSEWQSSWVGPNQVRTHFYAYDYPDQNASPTPQIRFHYNPGQTIPDYKVYDLQAYAVPVQVAGIGKVYRFRYSWDGRFLDLYKD
jgi:hypothetical protein